MPIACRSAGRRVHALLRLEGVRLTWAHAFPDPWDGIVDRDDIRHEALHSRWRRSRHSRAPVFSPSRWADKKSRWCARPRKKFLRNLDRGSPARDTSFRSMEGGRGLSYSFNSKSVAAVGNTARMHESNLRIFEQL